MKLHFCSTQDIILKSNFSKFQNLHLSDKKRISSKGAQPLECFKCQGFNSLQLEILWFRLCKRKIFSIYKCFQQKTLSRKLTCFLYFLIEIQIYNTFFFRCGFLVLVFDLVAPLSLFLDGTVLFEENAQSQGRKH